MRRRERIRGVAGAVLAAAALVALAGCSAPAERILTVDQVKAAQLTADQLAALDGTPAVATLPDFTAADLVGAAGSPDVVDPETCREYVQSIAVPGQVIVPSADAASTDAVVVSPHIDLPDGGSVEQAVRVLPDAAAATTLVADLRALATGCGSFSYGATTDVNRFTTVSTGDLPFDGDGYVSTVEVRGTQVVVATDQIYVMRFDNVVATLRGTAGRAQGFAKALSDDLRVQQLQQ